MQRAHSAVPNLAQSANKHFENHYKSQNWSLFSCLMSIVNVTIHFYHIYTFHTNLNTSLTKLSAKLWYFLQKAMSKALQKSKNLIWAEGIQVPVYFHQTHYKLVFYSYSGQKSLARCDKSSNNNIRKIANFWVSKRVTSLDRPLGPYFV